MNMENGEIKTNPLDYKFYGICVDKCPYQGFVLCNHDRTDVTDAKTQGQMQWCFDNPDQDTDNCDVVRGNCWFTPLNMSSIFWRCLPE